MKILKALTFALATLGFSQVAISGPMDLPAFQADANASQNTGRCVGDPISFAECKVELDYALEENLITRRAHEWGVKNGFYPVINRRNEVRAICKCGCFEADTTISTFSLGSGGIELVAAKDVTGDHRLVALEGDTDLDTLSTTDFAIKTLTKGDEEKALYVFEMADGRVLKVTQFHGMLLADGMMVAAKDVAVGSAFIDANSKVAVEVTAISREATDQPVYNFETETSDKASHIIIAEDFFVGDLIWQNQLSSELGEVLLRQ